MDLSAILMNSVWAGLFAAGLGILFTAPFRYVVPAFLCGFAGYFTRDALMSAGVSQNWSTAVAATIVVLVAAAIIRRNVSSLVVLLSGILPLGAALAMFRVIINLIKVSTLKGEALTEASIALNANMGKVFTASLAIAFGLGVGTAIVKCFKRKEDGALQ